MELSLQDFFVAYPNYQLNQYDLLNPFDQPMYQSLNNLKEFTELNENELKPKKSGIPLQHQRNISHFLSPLTEFDKLLLLHSVGTGKTCSAVNVCELAIKLRPEMKCLVILSNRSLMNDFQEQLAKTCTDGKYLPEDWQNLTERTYEGRRNTLLSKYYTFHTRETFASNYLYPITNEEIVKQYSNLIIVIDEAHHLKDQPKKKTKDSSKPTVDIYKQFWRFLHLVKNCKTLLLSGTPMRDDPREIASLMNLILPATKEDQLPYGEFKDTFFNENGQLREDKKQLLYKAFHGKVSYLRKLESDIKVINEPSPITIKEFKDEGISLNPHPDSSEGKIEKLTIMALPMMPFQTKIYKQAFLQDTTKGDKKNRKESSLYQNSIQASNFCFPDNYNYIDDPKNASGSWGNTGFNKYFSEKKGSYTMKKSLEQLLTYKSDKKGLSKDEKQDIILSNIKQCSIKMGETIEKLLKSPDQLSFVYLEQVTGSGTILFCAILQLFDFSRFRPGRNKKELIRTIGEEKKKGVTKYRFAFIDGKTSKGEIQNIINIFNTKENLENKYISFIVGSQVIAEGYSFHNINNTFILSPHWNNAGTEQAIGRTNRAFSHYPELKLKELHIYRFAVAQPTGSKSIDLIMYKRSEDKDILIMKIMRLIKESAFDCWLNKKRNLKVTDKKGTRECDYLNDCNYQCKECAYYGNEDENELSLENLSIEDLNFFQKIKTKWQCKPVPEPSDFKDTTNYNLYFAEAEIINIKETIKNMYRINFSYELQQILSQFSPQSFMITLRALKELIDESVPIKNKYGFNCYLRENNNLYFLVDNITYPNNFNITYYVEHPATKELFNFSIILEQTKIKYLDNSLDFLSHLEKPTKKSEQKEYNEKVSKEIKMLPLSIQEIFLEKTIIADQLEIKKRKLLRDTIYNIFRPDIIENEKVIISKLLYPDHLYCLTKGKKKWNQCDNLLTELKSIEEKKNENVAQGYYGILFGSGKQFHIRNVSTRQHFEGRESKGDPDKLVGLLSKPKGKKCLSYETGELIYIAILSNLELPQSYEILSDEEVLNNVKREASLNKLKKFMEKEEKKYTGKKYVKLGIKLKLLPIEKMNNKQLNILNYVIKFSKDELCKVLEKQYSIVNLMAIETEKSTTKKKVKE
jgi:superfamily II DNA or RNA helicase